MPIYEYRCPKCEANFELLRPISQCDSPGECPTCGTTGKKVVAGFAARSRGASGALASVGAGSCTSCAASSCSSCG